MGRLYGIRRTRGVGHRFFWEFSCNVAKIDD